MGFFLFFGGKLWSINCKSFEFAYCWRSGRECESADVYHEPLVKSKALITKGLLLGLDTQMLSSVKSV